MVVADLDLALITKRKRMMDSVGHYSRPELLSLLDRSHPRTSVTDVSAQASPASAVARLGASAPIAADRPPSPEGRRHVHVSACRSRRPSSQCADGRSAGGWAGGRRRPRGASASRRGGAGPSDHRPSRWAAHTSWCRCTPPDSRRSACACFRSTGRRRDARRRAALLAARRAIPIAEVALPPAAALLRAADRRRHPLLARSRAARAPTCWRRRCCSPASATTSRAQRLPVLRDRPVADSRAARSRARRRRSSPRSREAAVRLDGVKHMVLTTGTPRDRRPRRGASSRHAPPRSRPRCRRCRSRPSASRPTTTPGSRACSAAGVDTLGMHLEAVSRRCARAIMPGKAEVPVARYLDAFEAAVAVFGRGQVSTYILAGPRRSRARQICSRSAERLARSASIRSWCPFVPIAGTPLAAPAPPPSEMHARPVRRRSRACCARTACVGRR